MCLATHLHPGFPTGRLHFGPLRAAQTLVQSVIEVGAGVGMDVVGADVGDTSYSTTPPSPPSYSYSTTCVGARVGADVGEVVCLRP